MKFAAAIWDANIRISVHIFLEKRQLNLLIEKYMMRACSKRNQFVEVLYDFWKDLLLLDAILNHQFRVFVQRI